jgi:hypothetical protein
MTKNALHNFRLGVYFLKMDEIWHVECKASLLDRFIDNTCKIISKVKVRFNLSTGGQMGEVLRIVMLFCFSSRKFSYMLATL